MDDEYDPQTLYQGWKGWGPFRQYLYVGITNSPGRRMREHRARSDWMLEARTIRLTRYPDRRSVLEAEKLKIQTKRPLYNVQHNRHEVEVTVSAEDMAAVGAAVCLGVLVLRWLADTAALWWMRHLAAQQDVPVTLPAKPNRFTEPSLTLTMFEVLTAAATGQLPALAPAPLDAGREEDILPKPSPSPAIARAPLQPVATSNASALGMMLFITYYLISGQQTAPHPGTRPASFLWRSEPGTSASS